MKRLRQILALALTAAMALGMLAVSAAATDEVTSLALESDGVTLKLPVTYTLHKDAIAQTVTFDYKMVSPELTAEDVAQTNVTGKTVAIKAGPELDASVSFSNAGSTWQIAGDTKTATEYAAFDLSALLGEGYGVGVYRYKLTESLNAASDVGSIAAGLVAFQVDFYVTHSATTDADEISAVVAQEITTNDDGDEVLSSSKTGNVKFDHGTTGTDLIITAHVEGNYPDYTKEFEYTVNIPAKGAGQGNNGVTFTDGDTILVDVTIDGVTETKTLTVGTDFVQKLKDGDSMVLTHLPEGMIFTVTQTQDADWSTRNTYSFEGTIKDENVPNKNNGTDGDNNNFVVSYAEDGVQIHSDRNVIDFYNRRDISVDTGISVDLYPSVLIMTMALCGGLLFVSKRKTGDR